MSWPLIIKYRRDSSVARAIARVIGVALVGLCLLPACTDDAPTAPPAGTGFIRGRVHDGAPRGDEELVVRAECLGAGGGQEFTAPVAADGTYVLSVPAGPALVSLERSPRIYYEDDGLTFSRAEADTVRVAGEAAGIDFACGRVLAEVGLPPALRDGWWRFRLHAEADPGETVAEHGLAAAEVLTGNLRFVPPGRYLLTLHAANHGGVYLPATYAIDRAEVIAVTGGAEARHASDIVGLAVIEGCVTGSWQELGMDEPEVKAHAQPDDWVSTRTDPDGRFSLRLLAGGTFRCAVLIGGVLRWIGGDDFSSATPHTVAAGETLTGVTHVESGLECVFSAQSLPPAYLSDAYLYDEQGGVLPVAVVGGNVRVANLVPGTIYLRLSTWVRRAIWLPQFWDRRFSLATADPIVVPGDGGVARVTATLEKGGRILGRLRDADGEVPDPSRLFVLVHAQEDSVEILALFTNRDFESGLLDPATGDYMLTQLANGRYRLRAYVGAGQWTWWPGRAAWDSAGVVTIDRLADVTDIDWQLR